EDKRILADGERIAIRQRHLFDALIVDPGAVGALKILQAKTVRRALDDGMNARHLPVIEHQVAAVAGPSNARLVARQLIIKSVIRAGVFDNEFRGHTSFRMVLSGLPYHSYRRSISPTPTFGIFNS